MPVYKTTTLTAKWVDLGEYFSITDGELKLVKKYPYSQMILPQAYERQHVSSYTKPEDATYDDNITSLVVDANGLKLENECFIDSNLQTVKIYGTNIQVGETMSTNQSGVFANCMSLSTVTFEGSGDCELISSTMGSYGAFMGDAALTSVVLKGVSSIGNNCFMNCSQLSKVTVSNPNGSVKIGSHAFSHIKISDSNSLTLTNIASIGYYCFDSSIVSSNITNYRFGLNKTCNGVNINGNAFIGCTGLKGVSYQCSVNSIGGFSGCSSLEYIYCDSADSTGIVIGNDSFGWNGDVGCNNLKEINIRTGLKSISDGAFSGCSSTNFTKLIFGDDSVRLSSNSFQLTDSSGTATGYLNLDIYTSCDYTVASSFYGTGIKRVYARCFSDVSSEFFITINNYSPTTGVTFAYSSGASSIILLGATNGFSLTDLKAFENFVHDSEKNTAVFGPDFYNLGSGTDYYSTSSDYCFNTFDYFTGAYSRSFTTGFDKVKYYGIDSSTFTYCESNAFQKSDVIITAATHFPDGWKKDMAGDYSGSNIILGVTPNSTFHNTFTNYGTANEGLYVTMDYDTGIKVMVGFSPATVASTSVDCTTNQGSSSTKLMAHPFLDVSPISVTLPTNISYIGSSFFEGIDLTTTKIIYNGKKSVFDAITKADDWYDLGLGSSSYIHSVTNTGTPVVGQINCTVAE
jgi:hypothetical protein